MNQECIVADKWLPVFLQQLDKGKKIRLSPSGYSMYPFLVGGRDTVILEKIDRPLRRGDVCLYRRENGLHVLHRIWKINKKGEIYMLGDHQTHIEGPLRRDQMLAVACSMIRNEKERDCCHGKLKALATLWQWIRPFRPIILGLWNLKRQITGEEAQDRAKYEAWKKEHGQE